MTTVIKGDSNINLDFSTGGRITGDFSNGTFANRVAFQTSTTNGATTVYAIPNGTSTTSGFIASTDPSVANGSEVRVVVNGTTATLTSSARGSGTTLPMTFDVGSERMRIDTSGNVGIGTSSPTSNLDVRGNMAVGPTSEKAVIRRGTVSGSNGISIQGNINDTVSDTNPGASINVGGGPLTDTFEGNIQLTAYGNTAGGTRNNIIFSNRSGTNTVTERARIDSSGNLLVGTTSATGSGKTVINASSTNPALSLRTPSASGTVAVQIFFDGDDTDCGSIDVNTTANTTAYTTSSDYRLKQDVAPMTGALEKIAALNPVTWNWKHAPEIAGEGFIAHELQEVAPNCVTGEKDAVDADGNPQYQGIDTSFLVATLTAAIQEQQAIITALTARVEALEGQP